MQDKADAINDWTRTLNLKGRDKNQFLFSMRKVLGINDASSNIVIDVEKLKKDFEENKEKLEQAYKKIEKIENEFNYCNEKNRELQYQIKVHGEENKKKLTAEEFMRNYQIFKFEEIKYIMLELNFERFKENFITNNFQFIVQISYTNDQKHIFVCKFLSRL
ncbi:hypothetical protein SteCoe_38999 [Stentor coeruleus]|uniref:Uncharacterized protein n=1 Tax=Stentor coeruleus TaxID=5963 RepID=A0A1R2AL57_9CILI|nr:hypothetical protein SteCoe_38999 [Stentor coeruleus]